MVDRASRILRGALLAMALAGAVAASARETLTVAHDQWVGYAGFFVAQAQGYFTAEGLDIREVEFSGPGEALPPLVTGHVDIALTTLYNLAVVAARGAGAVEAVYMLDTSDGADAVVARADIADTAGLKGKSVAVTVGEVNELLLRKALEAAHLPAGAVHLVNLNADDAGAALLAGRVDAAVTWEPWVSRASASGAHVIFSSADVPDLILDAVAITPATQQARSAAIARFLRAIDRGVTYLRAHPDAGRALVARALKVPDADAGRMLARDRLYGMAQNRALLAPGGPARLSLATLMRFLAVHDGAPVPADAGAVLDNRFVVPQP